MMSADSPIPPAGADALLDELETADLAFVLDGCSRAPITEVRDELAALGYDPADVDLVAPHWNVQPQA